MTEETQIAQAILQGFESVGQSIVMGYVLFALIRSGVDITLALFTRDK